MKRLAALAAFKLSVFLNERVSDDFFKKYSRLISADVTEDELDQYPQDAEELFEHDEILYQRYSRLEELCGYDETALNAVQLYLMALMEERTLELLREGMGTAEGLTIETAARITYPDEESIELMSEIRAAFEKVKILLQADPMREPLKAPFRLDWRLAAWLSGDDTPDEKSGCSVIDCSRPLPESVMMEKAIDETVKVLKKFDGCCFVHISGEKGCGRQFFARHCAQKIGRDLLSVAFDSIYENGELNVAVWRKVQRELLLSNRMLCLHDIALPEKRRDGELSGLLKVFERDLKNIGCPVFLTTDSKIKTAPFMTEPVYMIEIPIPTIPQGAELWRQMAKSYLGKTQLPADGLAAKMTLTAGQIEKIVKLMSCYRTDGDWQERDIFKLCYKVLDDGRYENIRFVESSYNWDDLQLEEPLKALLNEVCAQVEHQALVLDEWGLRRRYPYGRCVSMLMSGPPGTGKTMTAQVLASRLGLELYKVDLSQIVDKYIGETEKRLKQVFDQAEKSNMVLFFDEADALLGKRSEVKDSKDKYANVEVAYLLQRMEEYNGIVLMATNQASNIDSAFTRRFRYHLVFTLPDEDMRRRLWQDALAGIPEQGVQYDYLARQFELSGAQIKNIALNAAYRAAADDGVMRMVHLVKAIFREFQKEGKIMLASDFGEYGVMLSDYLSAGRG